ncbi:MAG: hypothetical protein DWQ02_19415 [Bacteroidetes bacterium]|nr:MAG: hypothetical protein DWQ02_19415 [Bacteroidota bacterium]
MNNQRINLALTVGLLNRRNPNNGIDLIKELMLNLKEAGAFVGSQLKEKMALNASHQMEKHALTFENCTLDVELVHNPQTNRQSIHGFQLR